MLRKRLLALVLAILIILPLARADEGMWIPILLKKHTIEQMHKAGFKLTAEDIYDINKASLKDAVVGLGRAGRPFSHFCTAELISDEGLIITNHHCGFRAIQQHSTVEHDYLTDGFWAYSKEEELANPGITASFLKRMEDVTDKVLEGITEDMTEEERGVKIQENQKAIIAAAEEGTNYRANIKQFFAGNEFYLSVYEIFEDVRLVGAPPSAIGKFGGDTDNWSWPRHTGDFSLFRIYASKENMPAEYAKDNQPLKPIKHFEISLKGINKGDFTMVLGYPGTTEQYIPSYAVQLKKDHINPLRIKLRGTRLEVMNKYMENDKAVRIQYASKYAGISNGWKKWIGENKGLERFETVKNKQELEAKFKDWAKKNPKYNGIVDEYEKQYKELTLLQEGFYYAIESALNIEIVSYAGQFSRLYRDAQKEDNEAYIKTDIERLVGRTESHFKDYYKPIDKEITAKVLDIYYNGVPEQYRAPIIDSLHKKFNGDFEAYAAYLFDNSVFANKEKVDNFLENFKAEDLAVIENDPAFILYTEVVNYYRANIQPAYAAISDTIDILDRKYVDGLRKMQPDKIFYPDANSTFRVAFGKINGYEPRDRVKYSYQTTLKGIIEKDNPDIYDYRVPQKLKNLYNAKDFGKYTNSTGEVPVCFIGTNHTTGGNSGSPVLDAEGRLIGINFDRAWEGVMSDITYKPEICRNIMLDMRYVLFIVDKFANAQNLINEMSIVK
ncbi:MAG: serine protease [Salinivirgaceae bacterium]|nr:MAG: serine protease [Salinivirgaceae bacterium]